MFMSNRRYEIFDLLIDAVGRTYKARVLRSPANDGETTFESPFTGGEVEDFFARLGFSRRTRGGPSSQLVAAQELGGRLFDAVFRDEILAAFRSSLEVCRKNHHGLRLLLRLGSVPDLAILPWEYLFDRSRRRFIGQSEETTIVRCPSTGDVPQRLQVRPPLRILVVAADPQNLPRLDIEQECENLRNIFDSSIPRIAHVRLGKVTLESLRRQLKSDHFHVLHFIGHGEFDEKSGQGALFLEDENRKAHPVEGARLAALLHRKFSLVVLNSCHGAKLAAVNPFGGVAHSLLQQGIPAVVAMQTLVSDIAAVTFAREFYTDLAQHGSVDHAMTEARRAILVESDVEWGIPVLHMRSDDDRIFQIRKIRPSHEGKLSQPAEPPAPASESSIYSQKGPGSDLQELKWSATLRALDHRGYTLTSKSPVGVVTERMILPLEGESLPVLLAKLASGIHSQAGLPESVKELGGQLCDAMFPSSVRQEFDTIYKFVRDRGAHLSLTLEIGWELKRLASLPWEFLYRENFLNIERNVSFVRCSPGGSPTRSKTGEGPLRILLVGSSEPLRESSDEMRWWADRKWAKEPSVETEILVDADREAVRQALWKGGFDVLHFNCRAAVKEFSSKGVLLLESRREGMQPIDADYLAGHMSEEEFSKKLMMVSFEPTGLVESEINPLIDLAGTLVGRGAPCALALHFPLSFQAAVTFWGTVYRLMAEGEEVSRAVSDGRRAVRAECPGSNEWGSPALFAAFPEGVPIAEDSGEG